MKKILTFSLVSFLCTFVLMGCMMRTRNGTVVGVGLVHDERWHYDHDYDDNWRSHHPYRTGIFVAVHDDRWHYDNDYDDNWRSNHPWHGHRDW